MKELLVNKFVSSFGQTPQVIVRAPGRINIIGEHTDYNEGWVMPGAIDRYLYVLISIADAHHWIAQDLGEEIIPDGAVDQLPLWAKYIEGTIRLYTHNQIACQILISGNLPVGAGISSSSALTCGLLAGLQFLSNRNESNEDLAITANRVEREIIGLQGGIMDQYAIMLSKAGQVMMLDCKTRQYNFIDAHLPGFQWLLINTKVKHSLIDSDYNNRADQCRQAVSILQNEYSHIHSLRDADLERIHTSALPDVLRKRSVFVVQENARVHTMVHALNTGNVQLTGQLLNASHAGLRYLYEVSCAELDLIADVLHLHEDVAGGRMMGGGFGGCVICLVKQSALRQIMDQVSHHFFQAFGFDPEFIEFSLSNGVEIINS